MICFVYTILIPSTAFLVEDAPGSRATSSRMRRFRYSEELSGDLLLYEAVDNGFVNY